ncbi:cohesin complex subunit, partial [Dispira parvispora]
MLSTPQRRSTRRSALAKKDHTVQTPRQSTGQTDDGGYMSSSSLSSLESEPDSGTDDYIDTNSPLGAKATGDKSRRGTKARSRTHRQGNGNSSAQAKSRGGRKSGSTKPVSLWDVSSVPGTTKSGLLGKARLLHTTKRRRLSANAAEPTEEESHDEEGALHEHDSALFDAILDEDTALDAIVSDWIDSFSEDSSAAFQELLGLFLRASGCPFTIEQVEFDDEDSAVRVLNALQTKLKSEALPDFPMQSRARQYKKFSNHCLDFVTRLLKQGQHVLVFSGPFTDMLSLWLTFMSSSSFRPFRYTATLVALKVISVLCELHQTLQTNLSTSHRQLQSEQKKRRRSSATSGSQDRMRQLEENVQTFTQQKTELEQQLDKWFELIFNHRYRDKDAHIRQHCVQALAEWISTLPTRFLEDKYLRFLGWVMSDKATVVRQTALVELQGLYSQSTLIPGLTHFTTRFVGRIVHMALYDADITGVRVAAMELLTTLCKYGLVDHALRGFTENQAIRDDTTTDSPDTTLDDIALNVLRRFHIVLNAEGEATATETICICENMTDGEHRKECYEAQLVGHLLVQNPLQAYVIPHLFHPHSGIRQATASLVAWWISHQWTPALLGFEKATEMDPLGLEAAEMESSEETSASDEDTDEEEEEKDHLSSWDLHSALTLKQKRHFCTYKAVVALLDVFTYTSRLNSVPPDNTLSISLEMIRMEDAMGTRSVTSALDVQVCAATSALATQLPELMHWRALCTYMAIDHTLSGSDALDIVGQLAETTLASPTRSNRRTGTPKQR